MAGNDWFEGVPVPMDANGCVVPLDTKKLVYKGETYEVLGFLYSTRLKCWFAGSFNAVERCVSSCTLPDSWESLEEDSEKAPRDYVEGRGIEVGSDGRVAAMVRDIVRRAKALVGVSDGH